MTWEINKVWHRGFLWGHLGCGFTGWQDARLYALDADRTQLRFEVLGHYFGLYR